jgi:sialic acid synthase SpsE/quercetin dioxygenase-like cupin family protein
MNKIFGDEPLFVFDLANNHQGSVEHGSAIVRMVGDAVRRHGVRAIVKFQFRELDSFVHPKHRQGSPNKHIPRFLSTRLSWSQFATLYDLIRSEGMIPMTTPFDEESVDIAVRMGFDVLKVASCSAQDWPLLEKVAAAGKPVVFSTGGCSLADIDNLASFFDHRGVDFAIMHCISVYPTPPELCALNQIDALRARFPGRPIGWSTHEDQDEVAPVQIAYAKGARIFERHVGLEAEAVKLNAYSSNAEQIDRWLAGFQKARALCGPVARPSTSEAEKAALVGLRRGIYARRELPAGTTPVRSDLYFCMPCEDGQLHSGEFRDGMRLLRDVPKDGPLMSETVQQPTEPEYLVLKRALHAVKAMLNEAKISLDTEFRVEYSHHQGVRRFPQVGCLLIECVNREYCKKLLVQLPGQAHPVHYHQRKEETFQVLHGELDMEIDGRHRRLRPGETALVLPGVWHRFWTDTGAIVEEISTTHFKNDSYYRDPEIQAKTLEQRKTKVEHWGRFELLDRLEESRGSD